jgi:hypothetical protein
MGMETRKAREIEKVSADERHGKKYGRMKSTGFLCWRIRYAVSVTRMLLHKHW